MYIYLAGNHIGGTGAALLWNQFIRKGYNLNLNYNVIGDDKPNAFFSALSGTRYERSNFCQLQVSMLYNKLLCSDLKYISEHVPKGVVLTTGDKCLATIRKILNILFQYYIGNNHPLYVRVGIQWIPYAVLTFQLIYSIETPLWGCIYFFGSLLLSCHLLSILCW